LRTVTVFAISWQTTGWIYAFISGQLRFWNPDDLNASQTGSSPPQDWIEEKLQEVCEDLGITRDGHLNRKKLVSICEQYGLQNVDGEVSLAVCSDSGIIIMRKTELATGWEQLCMASCSLIDHLLSSCELIWKILSLRKSCCIVGGGERT
jgi:hypothetical protein